MKSLIKQDKNLIDRYRNKKLFTPIDAIIIAITFVAIIICCISSLPSKAGSNVKVYHSGKEIGIYSLSKEQSIELLDGKMILTISNGTAFINYSDCKNQICVKSKSISKAGERIVCSPNKISVVVECENDMIITGGAL